MSMAKSSSSEQESVSGEPASCSGVSLTAAVLTYGGHHEDSLYMDDATAAASQQAEGDDEGERGRGRKRVPCENGGEGVGDILLKSLPSRGVRRRARHSPPKKRANEDGIRELLDNIPEVAKEFDIISKIGEGTFSSVYMASVKGVPEERFAIKHLIPTSVSFRIENELKFLQMLGGRDNVMSVCCCLRHRDHVALIMPYFQHDRFVDYLPHMTVSEAQCYMRALFLALRNIHSHHIIHRDIKPSNFLYNRATKQFQLVDFGLAHLESEKQSHKEQKGQSKSRPQKRSSSRLLHSSTPTVTFTTNLTKPTKTANAAANNSSTTTPTTCTTGTTTTNNNMCTTRLNGIVAPPMTYQRQLHHRAATKAAAANNNSASSNATRWTGSARTKIIVLGQARGGREGEGKGRGGRASLNSGATAVEGGGDEVIRLCPLRHKVTEVCTACLARSHQTAPRAGTPGFRAPEVLLKYPHQTTAVDMWSAGVIFLCILSGRYPFFRAHDDMSALAQIVSLMGSKATADAAKAYGKSLVCEPEVVPVMDLKTLCSTLRANSTSSLSRTAQSSRKGERDAQPAPPKRTKRSSNRERELGPPTTTPPLGANVRRSPRKQSLRSKLISGGSSSLDTGSMCNSEGGSGSDSDSWNQVPDSAYDLLYRCLDLNPATRITAELALQHNFMVDNG